MRKGKLYTFIHIFGLTLGITACLLIGTVVIDELSYDKQWSRSADTYRLLSIREGGGTHGQKGGTVYGELAPTLKQNFPEVEEYSEIYPRPVHLKVKKTDTMPLDAMMLHADTAALGLLDIEWIVREDIDPAGDISKVILSESFSKLHFAGENPLGQRIYDVPSFGMRPREYMVAGIMKDIPPNTHLRADMILLLKREEQMLRPEGRSQGYARHYVLLRKGTNPREFEQKMNSWYSQFTETDKGTQFALQAMEDIYLKTDFPAYQFVKGNIQHSYIFAGVAILLLAIACINYINLHTARAGSRLKEMGVQKILGASRRDILLQSLSESVITFSIAGCIAFLAYYLALPVLEQFIGHPLAFNFGSNGSYLIYVLLAFLGICLFSGMYPAWLVSGFRMTGNLQRILNTGKTGQGWLRKSLVVLQFSISIAILVSMFVVQRQVHFLRTNDVGFDSDGLLSIGYVSWDNKSNALKNELLKNPAIESVSFSGWLPTDAAGNEYKSLPDPDNPNGTVELWSMHGEPNLAQTLGLRLKEGRFLDPEKMGDAIPANDFEATKTLRPALITASTARIFRIDSLNQPFHEAGIIPVGIIEDFNAESLHKKAVPTAIVGYRDPSYGSLLIRTQPGSEQAVMHDIAQVWKELYPDKYFDIQVVRDTLARQYEAEEKLQSLFRLFSLMTMLLAAMGVFGLIVHSLSLRIKEIGIRKVLGASVSGIVFLLSRDFVRLVMLAIVIASPIAWWLMSKWLEDFAYRTEIQWWMFALAGLGAVIVALLTVGAQAIRAAVANPVDSLRDE